MGSTLALGFAQHVIPRGYANKVERNVSFFSALWPLLVGIFGLPCNAYKGLRR